MLQILIQSLSIYYTVDFPALQPFFVLTYLPPLYVNLLSVQKQMHCLQKCLCLGNLMSESHSSSHPWLLPSVFDSGP